MCFENLRSKHQELLQFLKTENYSATTIRIVSNEITIIIENAENFGWQTYRDVYHAYEAQGLSKSVLRSKSDSRQQEDTIAGFHFTRSII